MNRFLLPVVIMTVPFAAHANCDCVCVNGHVEQLCDSSYDMPTICAAQICPIAPPTLAPLAPAVIPPIGTSSCWMDRIYNSITGQYEWTMVCQ